MKIILPDSQIHKMKVVLRKAGAREVGGILMAEQLAPDHFSIVDFSVDTTTGTYAHFVRSPEHHQIALEKFFKRTNYQFSKFNYLGEWHSHPSFSTRPSNIDIASMLDLVNGERKITFAALMIVKLRHWFSLEKSITVFTRDKIYTEN